MKSKVPPIRDKKDEGFDPYIEFKIDNPKKTKDMYIRILFVLPVFAECRFHNTSLDFINSSFSKKLSIIIGFIFNF